MRLLILGATGAVGKYLSFPRRTPRCSTPTAGILIVRELLSAPHPPTLVLYVRSPTKIPQDISSHPDVVIITGQLTDVDSLTKAVEGVDAVISTLGPLVKRGPFQAGGNPLAKAYKLLIELMHTHHVTRLIALGTTSIEDPSDKFSYKFWILVNGVATVARNAYKEFVEIGKVIREEGSDLDWTVVRVPVLTDQKKNQVVAGYVGDGKTGVSLSRAALTAFIVGELEHGEWIHKAPLISNL
jgi:putative NADH-flavin reductase